MWRHPVAHMIERAPHTQRLCACCSGPDSVPPCGPLVHVISSRLPHILSNSLPVLSKNKGPKAQKISLKKDKLMWFARKVCHLRRFGGLDASALTCKTLSALPRIGCLCWLHWLVMTLSSKSEAVLCVCFSAGWFVQQTASRDADTADCEL